MKLKSQTVSRTLTIDKNHLYYVSTFIEILLKWLLYTVLMKCFI